MDRHSEDPACLAWETDSEGHLSNRCVIRGAYEAPASSDKSQTGRSLVATGWQIAIGLQLAVLPGYEFPCLCLEPLGLAEREGFEPSVEL